MRTLRHALDPASPAGPSPAVSNGSSPRPDAHVHGLSVSSTTGQVLLATHDGLFDITKQPAAKIGPTNDLMGFTGGTDHGVLYASGHPGEGSDLANPLGLIRSTDAGKTWEKLSRQGESDFHALTATKSGIVGFDGALTVHTSADAGATWTRKGKIDDTVQAVAAVKGPEASPAIWAATASGIVVSTDGGATFRPADAS